MLYRALAITATVLITAGCAGATTPASSPSDTPPKSDQRTGDQPKTDQPKSGGTLNGAFTSDPYDWDPTTAGISLGNQHGWATAHESLLTVKLGADVDYNEIVLQPALAERWEVSPDAKTYTFHLRKGVKFHNLPPVNGREITSADVKWSYEYASRTGAFKGSELGTGKFSQFFQGLEAVETPDPYTAVVKFSAPFAPFLSNAAEFANPIMAHEVFDKDGSHKDNLIGAGPFQLDMAASQKGSRWVFKKHPSYWQPGKPYLDEVRWLVIEDEATLAAAFATKQVDVRISGPESAEEAKKKYTDAVVYDYVDPGGTMLYMNVRRPPLNDVRVRRAISLALDREESAKVLNDGKAPYAVAGAFTGFFTEAEMRAMLKHDPEQSKRLLSEAGYADGLSMEHLYPGARFGEAHVTDMQLLQSHLKKVGINLTLKSFDLAEYLKLTRGNTFDLTLRGLSTGIDVDSFLFGSFHPTSGRNYNGVDDPKLTALIEASRQEVDGDKRREIVRQAARYITENALALFAHGRINYQVAQKYVKGFNPNRGRSVAPFAATWLDK